MKNYAPADFEEDCWHKTMPSGRHNASFHETYPLDLCERLNHPHNQSNLVIAEVGSGEGQICEWVNEKGYNVIGLEPNKNYINRAREYATNKRLNLKEIIDGDRECLEKLRCDSENTNSPYICYHQINQDGNIPLPTSSIDGFVLHRVLSGILDPKVRKTLISEIYRVLKSDGILSFYDFLRVDNEHPLANPMYQRRYESAKPIFELLARNSKFREMGLTIPDYILDCSQEGVTSFICFQPAVKPDIWELFNWEGYEKLEYLDFKLEHLYSPDAFIKIFEAELIRLTHIGQHFSRQAYEQSLGNHFQIVSSSVETNTFQYEKDIKVPVIKLLLTASNNNT